MGNKYKITLSVSFVLAMLFSMPWIAVIEQARLAGFSIDNMPVKPRVLFIFLSVFLSATILFSANFFWKKRFNIQQPVKRIAAISMMNLVLVVLISFLLLIAANGVFGINALNAYFTFYLFRNLSIAVVVVLVTYVFELVDRLRQEKIEVLTLQNKNSEIELAVLRNQIDPHFLFNTLTSLSSLARTGSKETIPFIDHMADSFRYMLETREHKTVKIREELSFLKSYLFMMKKRFETGIHIDIQIEDQLLDKTIPQFAFQIAVENAIKHNIVSSRHVLHIELFSRECQISIRNNLQEKNGVQGYGIGVENLAQRYWLMGKKKIQIIKNDKFFEIILPLL